MRHKHANESQQLRKDHGSALHQLKSQSDLELSELKKAHIDEVERLKQDHRDSVAEYQQILESGSCCLVLYESQVDHYHFLQTDMAEMGIVAEYQPMSDQLIA